MEHGNWHLDLHKKMITYLPPHDSSSWSRTKCMGQEHLVVPSPFTRQICEQPPLSWAQGCCPIKKEKGREDGGREESPVKNQSFMNYKQKKQM